MPFVFEFVNIAYPNKTLAISHRCKNIYSTCHMLLASGCTLVRFVTSLTILCDLEVPVAQCIAPGFMYCDAHAW